MGNAVERQDHNGFRSLIGTLQTAAGTKYVNDFFRISIPHRYPTNQAQTFKVGDTIKISIPHRYPTNWSETTMAIPPSSISIPHRYPTNQPPIATCAQSN